MPLRSDQQEYLQARLIIIFSLFYTSKLPVYSLNSNYLPSAYLFAHNCDPSWRLQYSDLCLLPLFLIKDTVHINFYPPSMSMRGYRRQQKITDMVTRNFWQPGTTREVKQYVEEYNAYQYNKNHTEQLAGKLIQTLYLIKLGCTYCHKLLKGAKGNLTAMSKR